MAKMFVQSETLSAIADAIREKTGKTDSLTLEQMPEEIEGIEAGGYTLDDILTRAYVADSLTTDVETIADYALYNQKNIITVQANNCTSLSISAFEYCSNLETVDFSNLKTVSSNAFRYCEKLKNINMPNITTLGANAFAGCNEITEASYPYVNKIQTGVFQNCINLESVSFPAVTNLYGCNQIFKDCTNLKNAKFDAVVSCGAAMFQNCTSLEEITFPSMNGDIYATMFYGCTTLKKVDFGGVANLVRAQAFQDCTALETVIIRGDTVSTLSNVNNFINSGIANGIGYIYVPKTLADGSDGVAAYQTATNWSTYADRFRAIEDYPEICGEVSV